MVLQWLLAISAISAAIVWVNGRKIEVTMFGWMGALLFALIPLRNAMPAVPPVGVLSDFLEKRTREKVIYQRLAYLMRSGAPDSLDQLVANNFGGIISGGKGAFEHTARLTPWSRSHERTRGASGST